MVALLWVMNMNCTRSTFRAPARRSDRHWLRPGARPPRPAGRTAPDSVGRWRTPARRRSAPSRRRTEADRADPLAGRLGHDRDAGVQHILAGQFQMGLAAAEQARKQILQAGVDPLEGVLEAGAGLAVNFANGVFQRSQRLD
jgi:hypothetical protein